MPHISRLSRAIHRDTAQKAYGIEIKHIMRQLRNDSGKLNGSKVDKEIFSIVQSLLINKAPGEKSTDLLKKVFALPLRHTPEDEPSLEYSRFLQSGNQEINWVAQPITAEDAKNKDIYFINGIDSGAASYEAKHSLYRAKYFSKNMLGLPQHDDPIIDKCCGITHIHNIQSRFDLIASTQNSEQGDYPPACIFAEEVLLPHVLETGKLTKTFFNHSMGSAFFACAQRKLTSLLRDKGWNDTAIQTAYNTAVAVNIGYALNPRSHDGPSIPEFNIIFNNDLVPPQQHLVTAEYQNNVMANHFQIMRDEHAPNRYAILLHKDMMWQGKKDEGLNFMSHRLDRYLELLDHKNAQNHPQEFKAITSLLRGILTKKPEKEITQNLIENFIRRYSPKTKIQPINTEQKIEPESLMGMAVDMVAMLHTESEYYQSKHFTKQLHPAIAGYYNKLDTMYLG